MPKAGRPKLPKSQVRTVFPLRLSMEEKKRVQKAAKSAGERPTEWARNQLLVAAGSGTR